jgi:hypothetical protein
MSVITAPDIDPGDIGYSSVRGNAGAAGTIPIPVRNNTKSYFITTFAGNETINELETNLFLERYTLGSRGLVLRFYKILLPFAGFGVLELCIGYVISKKKQNKSILSAFLGGHAPPHGLLLSIS